MDEQNGRGFGVPNACHVVFVAIACKISKKLLSDRGLAPCIFTGFYCFFHFMTYFCVV
jgi:hypothetical protein